MDVFYCNDSTHTAETKGWWICGKMRLMWAIRKTGWGKRVNVLLYQRRMRSFRRWQQHMLEEGGSLDSIMKGERRRERECAVILVDGTFSAPRDTLYCTPSYSRLEKTRGTPRTNFGDLCFQTQDEEEGGSANFTRHSLPVFPPSKHPPPPIQSHLRVDSPHPRLCEESTCST